MSLTLAERTPLPFSAIAFMKSPFDAKSALRDARIDETDMLPIRAALQALNPLINLGPPVDLWLTDSFRSHEDYVSVRAPHYVLATKGVKSLYEADMSVRAPHYVLAA